MTLEGFIGLFAAMFIVAIIPGPAVFAITSTSATGGFKRGANMTIGFILADYLFISLAVSGLAFTAESAPHIFLVLKYFCGAYLIFMGVSFLLSRANNNHSVLHAHKIGSDILE